MNLVCFEQKLPEHLEPYEQVIRCSLFAALVVSEFLGNFPTWYPNTARIVGWQAQSEDKVANWYSGRDLGLVAMSREHFRISKVLLLGDNGGTVK